jgi:hypothetical protein
MPMVASVASTGRRVVGIDPHQAQRRADRNPLAGRGRAGDRCVNEGQQRLRRDREHRKPHAPGSAATHEGTFPHG